MRENETTMLLRFLERRADGFYELKQRKEEHVEKHLVFMRNVIVNWKGVGRFEIPQEKESKEKACRILEDNTFKRKGKRRIILL